MIPLAAVAIALAEFRFDTAQPRWTSPWFWAALGATVGLLIVVQMLRFGSSKRSRLAKPDYSATSLVQRRGEPLDRG